ncbi:hypothetical protein GTA08_BOTSDO03125 [Botryosphaeria dothidea]|uniref:Uncharacterized protein n=1 Tax=Botryosphaeria dothidea TaxID=55169 RepID=A0A8H4NC39_9PEZI|nr:hypothetical protein GTA08_BOTSDO03125 [Botryosphaeria dothidea]
MRQDYERVFHVGVFRLTTQIGETVFVAGDHMVDVLKKSDAEVDQIAPIEHEMECRGTGAIAYAPLIQHTLNIFDLALHPHHVELKDKGKTMPVRFDINDTALPGLQQKVLFRKIAA